MLSNSLSFMALSYRNSWTQMVNWADSHMFGITGMLKWQSPSFLARAEFNYRGFSNWEAALMTPAFDVEISGTGSSSGQTVISVRQRPGGVLFPILRPQPTGCLLSWMWA